MNESFDGIHIARNSFTTGADLPWQVMKFRPGDKNLSLQISHSFMVEEQERMLAELATRLEAVFALFFKS